MSDYDGWLGKRAAAGDQVAFEILIEQSRGRLHGLISTFLAPDTGLEREDAFQLVAVEAWKSIKRGAFNPHLPGGFYAFVSTAARHRLLTHAEHARRKRRWTGQPPASLDEIALDDGAPVLGSWVSYIDPLRVVLAREELRIAWALTTARQRQAVEDYLQRDGRHVPRPTMDAVSAARRKVRRAFGDAMATPLRLA